MTIVPIELTEKERMSIKRMAERYSVDEQTVADVYLGIRNRSHTDVVASPFGFPLILTERELKDRGFKTNGYKPI